MKKQVLLSVFAASLFAAPAALAQDGAYGLGATTKYEENGVYANTDVPATVAQIKDYNDKDLGRKAEQWTRQANPLKKGEVLKVEKGEAAKDAAANKAMAAKKAAAGHKVLPKTSAAK